jgi:hypothetical protein
MALLSVLASFEAFCGLGAGQRRQLSVEVATALGKELEPAPELFGVKQLVAVRHRHFGITMLVVPGGSFEMGLSEADIEEASEHVDWSAGVQAFVARLQRAARPVRRVSVRPFLCAVEPLRHDLRGSAPGARARANDAGCTLFAREEARACVGAGGFRLPSEVELEYLAREGGGVHFVNDGVAVSEQSGWMDWPQENALGAQLLNWGEWAADDWHDSYEGGPSTSDPWAGGDDCGVSRGNLPGCLQGPEEILFGLAAWRGRGATAGDGDESRYFSARPSMGLPL